jgi:aspartyl-tRNA(Asn)/glutamyl-tRNA(Gln) amidotransferase subunit C
MAERLTRHDVERIAALAHLELSDAEKDRFLRQLIDVLAHAEQIQAIDTAGIPPTSHVLSSQPADREDEPRPQLPRAEALANAPDASLEAGLFRVPRVIDGRG